MAKSARLLDRMRFAHQFEGASADGVAAALAAYQNADGGFGNALEPDIRSASSQPVPTEHALRILDEIDRFDDAVVEQVCIWLESITTEEGGVPFVLASVDDAPHAPWWVATGQASLNPTAGIAGLLHKRGVEHPWVSQATTFCWTALPGARADLGPDDAISVLSLLEHAPDRGAAEVEMNVLGEQIRSELVAAQPGAGGYVKSPLDFAPHPDTMARALFDDVMVERHLDHLVSQQQEDGGWPISWEPPSDAARDEWRGFVTFERLTVLQAYGRLQT